MYQITVETHFSAAHQLRDYPGECANLHGHNYKVRVTAKTNKLDRVGIAFDFKQLEALTETITKNLDHKNINELPGFADINPTSENLARYIYHELQKKMADPVKLDSVQVWESDKYCVTYTREEDESE